MNTETSGERSKRILQELKNTYTGKEAFDLDGRGEHFVCEVEPTHEHPEYDLAIEVIISSKPHRHIKSTQYYRVLSGTLELYVGDEQFSLSKGDTFVIHPGMVHWATSADESHVEIVSKPGWTKEDHVPVK